MKHQIPLDRRALANERVERGIHEIAPDVSYIRIAFVNVVFCGYPGAGDRRWILIDAGIPGSAGTIRRAAEHRFGRNARPDSIVLTHGHFDHVGALRTLADEWDCPIFTHRAERPYLDGTKPYPPPDPSVGGMMARLSPLYPRGPFDFADRLLLLPADGTIPGMPNWRWVHTPGHSPGHVSLWRENDGTLIVGDAFVTTAQESAYAAVTMTPEMHGPPQYLTPDWDAARDSVRRLASLEPELVITGHGRAMRGHAMRQALDNLAEHFDEIARPHRTRETYADVP